MEKIQPTKNSMTQKFACNIWAQFKKIFSETILFN